MKIRELLREGTRELSQIGKEDAHLLARKLLAFVYQKNNIYLMIHEEENVPQEKEMQLKEYISQIKEGYPIQYILHEQEFMKLRFYVDENVLIPQPDTEVLVEEVIHLAKEEEKILDMCTGSGCIGISLAHELKERKVVVSDISQKALEISKKNALQNGIEDIEYVLSDLFEQIQGTFSIIVSNPPYIPTKEIENLPEEVKNEPQLALDGGVNGLYFYERLIKESPQYLNKGGYLCMEIGYDQKNAVTKLIEDSSAYQNWYVKKDLSGNDRVVIAQVKEK